MSIPATTRSMRRSLPNWRAQSPKARCRRQRLSRMPVKVAGLRQLFLALWRHLGGIRRALLAAPTELAPRHMLFGFPLFFRDFLRHDRSKRTMRAAQEPNESN